MAFAGAGFTAHCLVHKVTSCRSGSSGGSAESRRRPKTSDSHTWSLSKQPYPWLDAQEHVKRLYHAFGPQRLMWATDWPIVEDHATYAQAFSVVRDDMRFLNADDRRWMLSGTIERVWPFPA